MLEYFVSGAAFGAALTATGMYQPGVIQAQMRLENWHMVETFLTASGASTLIVTLCQKLGYINLPPRSYSSLGLFVPLDGNIIGGCLLGIGMTLSGSCPGTVFAQIGNGVPSGLYTLGGAVLGGLIWSYSLRSVITKLKSKSQYEPLKPEDLTVHGALGTSQAATLVGIEVLFSGVVTTISALGLAKTSGLVSPVVGGLLVAGAQSISILARRGLLGTSKFFEEVGDCISWVFCGGDECKPKSYNFMVIASGIVIGALGVSSAMPLAHPAPSIPIEPVKFVLGGVLLVLGSMIGGGCTSGHGISGISLLSVSSFVSVGAMFAGALGTAALV
ncbi:hypothetical protein F4861DRAFT_14542 [Xylaria intraflava]|nr:hypothetical protein F4861DRAFT_14542 [Xylaria intraflava]